MHAWETFCDGMVSDLRAVAKGLGGGYASIGAVLLSKRIADAIKGAAGWKHGHTYQAHSLACTASLAVQKGLVEEKLLERAREWGSKIGALLSTRLQGDGARDAVHVRLARRRRAVGD